MADTEDTFSDDDEVKSLNTNLPTQQTLFRNSKNNEIVAAPSVFDPDTGEDLTVQKVVSKAPFMIPVKMMRDNKGNQAPIEYDRISKFSSMGFKPVEQIEADQAASDAKQKLLSGNIERYHPSKSTSGLEGFSETASMGLAPQIAGGVAGLYNVAKGGDFTPAYEEQKNIQEGLSKAAQKENPYSYLAGQISGGVSQALSGNEAELGALEPLASKIPLGSVGRQAIGQGALGATTGAMEAVNQDKNINDVVGQAKTGAEYGALGSLGGQALGEIGSLAGKGVKGLTNAIVAPEAKQTLSEGLKGVDYTSPLVQEPILDKAAKSQKVFENTIDDIRGIIGNQKNDYLDSIPEVDHTPLIDNLNKNLELLEDMKSRTGDTERLNAIDQAKDKIKGSIKTLELNPKSAIAVDEIKQDLAPNIFDTQGNYISRSSGNANIKKVTDILENSRKNAQLFLEDYLPEDLKGTNQAYKDILNAQNPKEAYDKVIPTVEDMSSLIKGNHSLQLRNKINNLNDLNENVQNSSVLPQDVKETMQGLTNNFFDTARKAGLVTKVQSASGIVPNTSNQAMLAAKIGSYLSPTTNPVTKGISTASQALYNGVPKPIYDALPKNAQEAVKKFPAFAAQLLKSLPQTAGNTYNELKQKPN